MGQAAAYPAGLRLWVSLWPNVALLRNTGPEEARQMDTKPIIDSLPILIPPSRT